MPISPQRSLWRQYPTHPRTRRPGCWMARDRLAGTARVAAALRPGRLSPHPGLRTVAGWHVMTRASIETLLDATPLGGPDHDRGRQDPREDLLPGREGHRLPQLPGRAGRRADRAADPGQLLHRRRRRRRGRHHLLHRQARGRGRRGGRRRPAVGAAPARRGPRARLPTRWLRRPRPRGAPPDRRARGPFTGLRRGRACPPHEGAREREGQRRPPLRLPQPLLGPRPGPHPPRARDRHPPRGPRRRRRHRPRREGQRGRR